MSISLHTMTSTPYGAQGYGSLPGQADSGSAVPEMRTDPRPNAALRLAFYALAISIPFETVDIGLPITVSKLCGYLFFLTALLQPRLCFQRPAPAFWCFFAYFYVSLLGDVFHPAELRDDILIQAGVLVQMLTLFWVSSNLLRDRRVARAAILLFGVSCVALAFCQISGIGATPFVWHKIQRMSAFGQNPNELAGIFAMGILVLFNLAFSTRREPFVLRLLAWPMLLVLAMGIVDTGSRSGILSLAVGLLVYMFRPGSLGTKMRSILVVAAALAAVLYTSYNSSTTRDRWDMTLGSGSLAERENIYPYAWQMFLERPIMGWGTIQNLTELGDRVHDNEKQDTHNLFLWVLTETGLLGGIPFCLGLLICVRAAWEARGGPQGILPLTLMAALLMMNLSNTWLLRKLNWLILAYAIASGAAWLAEQRRIRAEAARMLPADEGNDARYLLYR
jgi:O-antigen ligase